VFVFCFLVHALRLPDYPHGVEDVAHVRHELARHDFSAETLQKLQCYQDMLKGDDELGRADAEGEEVVEPLDDDELDEKFEMPTEVKHKLLCNCCKEELQASEMLLQWPGGPRDDRRASEAKQGGKLIGVCLSCSDTPADDFKKLAKLSWRKFTGASKRKAELSQRGVTLRNLRKKLNEDFPGIKHRELNDLVAQRLVSMVIAFTASFLQDNSLAKMTLEGIQRYRSSTLRSLHDISDAGADYDADSWQWFEQGGNSDYLTQLSSCVLVSYLCRSCLWFGCNALWIPHRAKGWFRCPLCFDQYRMGTDAGHAGRRVVGLFNPLAQSWTSFAASFGDSDTAAWIRSQALAYLRSQSPEARGVASTLPGAAGSLGRLSAALERLGQPALFSHFPFSKAGADERQLQWNWRYDHLHAGVWGKKLTPAEASAPIFTEWAYLIELLGQVCLSGHSMAARM
jgi:hypothetical protein